MSVLKVLSIVIKKKTKKEVDQMPRGDGTGPKGQGSRTGRGVGSQQGGSGQGGRSGAGPDGFCACPKCGEKLPHQTGIPCYEQKCPKCGAAMTRG